MARGTEKNRVVHQNDPRLNSDEIRLIRFFRCLSDDKKSEMFYSLASEAFNERLPDTEIGDLLFGSISSHADYRSYRDPSSSNYIVYSGLEALGGYECLFGMSDLDEEESIPNFVWGSKNAAEEQGNYYIDHQELARNYILGAREKILRECETAIAHTEQDEE